MADIPTPSPTPSPSPSPSPSFGDEGSPRRIEVLLDFPSAIRAVIEGKRICRKEWVDNKLKDTYGYLGNGLLCIRKEGEDPETHRSWMVNDGDLMATDWFVL